MDGESAGHARLRRYKALVRLTVMSDMQLHGIEPFQVDAVSDTASEDFVQAVLDRAVAESFIRSFILAGLRGLSAESVDTFMVAWESGEDVSVLQTYLNSAADMSVAASAYAAGVLLEYVPELMPAATTQ